MMKLNIFADKKVEQEFEHTPVSRFLGFFGRRDLEVTETPANSPEGSVVEAAAEQELSHPVNELDRIPKISLDGQLHGISSQGSSGIDSTWDVKLDPKSLTVDCSCGLSMFRRFRNRD